MAEDTPKKLSDTIDNLNKSNEELGKVVDKTSDTVSESTKQQKKTSSIVDRIGKIQEEELKASDVRVNKFEDLLDDMSTKYSNFNNEIIGEVTNFGSMVESATAQSEKSQQGAIGGISETLTDSFASTLQFQDRMSYRIHAQADRNINAMNSAINGMEEMKSETGKFMEKRMVTVANQLLTADHKQAIELKGQMEALRERAYLLNDEERERMLVMSDEMKAGMETLTNTGSIFKESLFQALPKLDNFVENTLLGGGILGKFAGGMIRAAKAKKQAQAAADIQLEEAARKDFANDEMARARGADVAMGGEGNLTQDQMQSVQDGTNKYLQELVSLNRTILGLEEREDTNRLDEKEVNAEDGRLEERRHQELLNVEGQTVEISEGKCSIFGKIMGLLRGNFIGAAAAFLMSPMKAVAGIVMGGLKTIGGGMAKVGSMLLPKTWSSKIGGFFGKLGKDQAGLVKQTKTGGGILTKIVGKLKDVIKSIFGTIKTIFKSLGDVIKSAVDIIIKVFSKIGKGIAKVMKSLAKGIGYFGKKSVILGALSLIIVAGAIWVFAKAMVEFTKVTWKAVGVAAVSILILVGTLVALGALMMSGIGAVALLLGAAALVVVAGAMYILGKAMQEFGKAVPLFMPVFLMLALMFEPLVNAFSSVIESIGEILLAIAKGITSLIDNIVPIINALGDMLVKPIIAIGDAIAIVVTSIGDAIVKIIGAVTDSFERLAAPGLATGMAKTALGIGALGVAIAAFAVASAGSSILGGVAGALTGFLSLFGGAPPTALEVIAALSTMDPRALSTIPQLIDNISSSLKKFGGIELDTDGAENAIWIIAEMADELGNETTLTALSRLSRIDMSAFADGMLALFKVVNVGTTNNGLWDLLEGAMKFIDIIPEKLIDEKAAAFNRLAISIGKVADEMVRLDSFSSASGVAPSVSPATIKTITNAGGIEKEQNPDIVTPIKLTSKELESKLQKVIEKGPVSKSNSAKHAQKRKIRTLERAIKQAKEKESANNEELKTLRFFRTQSEQELEEYKNIVANSDDAWDVEEAEVWVKELTSHIESLNAEIKTAEGKPSVSKGLHNNQKGNMVGVGAVIQQNETQNGNLKEERTALQQFALQQSGGQPVNTLINNSSSTNTTVAVLPAPRNNENALSRVQNNSMDSAIM